MNFSMSLGSILYWIIIIIMNFIVANQSFFGLPLFQLMCIFVMVSHCLIWVFIGCLSTFSYQYLLVV